MDSRLRVVLRGAGGNYDAIAAVISEDLWAASSDENCGPTQRSAPTGTAPGTRQHPKRSPSRCHLSRSCASHGANSTQAT